MNKNLEAWSLQNSVGFYAQERSRVQDLYESERSMLLPVVGQVGSVLDIGCAAGNFVDIFKELNPHMVYEGLDTAPGMIDQAKQRHPGVKFHLGNGGKLPFEDGTFDLVFCVGVLNHNEDYLEMIQEMFRVCRRYVVVDLPRLVETPVIFNPKTSYMVLKQRFQEGAQTLAPHATRVPYVLANAEQAFGGIVDRLKANLSGLAAHGYYRRPHESVVIPYPEVLFTVVLLTKTNGRLRYHLRLPESAQGKIEKLLKEAGGEGASMDQIAGQA